MNASGLEHAPCTDPLLDTLSAALAAQGWECLDHTDCEGEAMLVATAPDGATWLLGRAVAGARAQRMDDEAWLATLCEGPPARVLAHLLARKPG